MPKGDEKNKMTRLSTFKTKHSGWEPPVLRPITNGMLSISPVKIASLALYVVLSSSILKLSFWNLGVNFLLSLTYTYRYFNTYLQKLSGFQNADWKTSF